MIRFVLVQQAVPVEQARLIVQEDEQFGVRRGCLQQIVRRCVHHLGIPAFINHVVDHSVEIGRQVVEYDQI